MDATAIKEIIKQAQIEQANDFLSCQDYGAIALPDSFNISSLENYQATRNRFSGKFRTEDKESFGAYCVAQNTEQAACFIEAEAMSAVAIFDLGNEAKPLHGKHRAILELNRTAPYIAFLRAAGERMSQKVFAEFIEEWRDYVEFYGDEETPIRTPEAVSKIRNVTVETARKIEHSTSDFSESKSSLEKIEAKAGDGTPPKRFLLEVTPYVGLRSFTFECRISVITRADDCAFVFKIERLEEVKQEMAKEFSNQIGQLAGVVDMPQYIGTFSMS